MVLSMALCQHCEYMTSGFEVEEDPNSPVCEICDGIQDLLSPEAVDERIERLRVTSEEACSWPS